MLHVLVDCSQVGYHHRGDRHAFGPAAVDLDDGKVLLLASEDVRSKLLLLVRIETLMALLSEQVGHVLG